MLTAWGHLALCSLHGTYSPAISVDENFVLVSTDDTCGNATFPVQSCPKPMGGSKRLYFCLLETTGSPFTIAEAPR